MHSVIQGHSADKVSKTYFAAKEWAEKDQKKARDISRSWRKDPDGTKERLFKWAKKSLATPWSVDGDMFYAHKESTCMAYVNSNGRRKADLTGI